ncbi:MAG: LacI family DNA-binding transcriptional regulator [Clostridia bacterium]|jgi:DNA-binding LacI/PurR family transcriptional regulator
MKKVNRNDIARLAGVSPATVSNVLNNKRVSSKLRKRVLDVVQELNYTPNLVARSLVTKSSKHIELIIPDIINPNYSSLAQGMQHQAHKNGYLLSISIMKSGENSNLERIIDYCIGRNVDAAVFVFCYDLLSDSQKGRLLDHDIILVDITHLYPQPAIKPHISVEPGYYEGMKKAFEHLVDLGHKKIAYITGGDGRQKKGVYIKSRDQAFKECYEKYFSFYDERYLIVNTSLSNYNTVGYRAGEAFVSSSIDFTAAIVASDSLVFGFIRALHDAGKTVPDDVSVVSFGDTPIAQVSIPTLTSVPTPDVEIGETVVRHIIEYMEKDSGKETRMKLQFPVSIIPRESTKRID